MVFFEVFVVKGLVRVILLSLASHVLPNTFVVNNVAAGIPTDSSLLY